MDPWYGVSEQHLHAAFVQAREQAPCVLFVDDLAARSALFSGADLRAVVERAVDAVIDDALEQGGDVPIGHGHLERALADSRPTTVDWLRTARNFVEFANDGGRYDDVLAFLRSPEGKAAKRDDAGDKDRPRRGRRR